MEAFIPETPRNLRLPERTVPEVQNVVQTAHPFIETTATLVPEKIAWLAALV
jgi:hypothetical protein